MRRAFSEKKRIRALYANETNYVHVAPVHGKVTGDRTASVTTHFPHPEEQAGGGGGGQGGP